MIQLQRRTHPKIRVERLGTFESPIEGEIDQINIKPLQEVMHSDVDLLFVKEACPHTVQYSGLCALCGKSLEEEKDYSGYNYEDRATIEMSHDNTGLKISFDEAAKIEHNTTDRLIDERKLILVVDLDQTVIHATVDPTVGEWQLDPAIPTMLLSKTLRHFVWKKRQLFLLDGQVRNWLQQNAPIMSNSVQGCWSFGENG